MSTATLLVALTFVLSGVALAGNEHGNGGGAIVCRDANKKIISAELLDLFEARVSGRSLIVSADSTERLTVHILSKVSRNNPLFAHRIRATLQNNRKIVLEVPPGITIKAPDDAFPWLYKDGCQLEGVAQYRDLAEGDQLFVNPEVLSAMSLVDQTAFWFHEAIYKVLRETDGETNSLKTRSMVATLFSDQTVVTAKPGQSTFISCFAKTPEGQNLTPFSVMIIAENGQFKVWLTRHQSQWIFPAKVSEISESTSPDFNRLLKYAFEGVTSLAQWNLFSEEEIATLHLKIDQEPKALTMRLTKQPYVNFKPVYRFQLYATTLKEVPCQINF